MRITLSTWARARRDDERGFTMVFAVMVLFIATLLVAGAFTAVEGDIHLNRTTTAQDKAYYAAEAGLGVYLYNLNTNSSYWEKCETVSKVTVPGTTEETYSYETLPSSSAEKKLKKKKNRPQNAKRANPRRSSRAEPPPVPFALRRPAKPLV